MSARSTQKSRTHEAIVQSAATSLAAHGVAGTSVADVMGRAGLTVGGFYAHFASKAAMVDAALRHGLAQRRARLPGRVGPTAWRRNIRDMVRGYLTPEHRDDPAGGCPMPSVTADIAHDEMGRDALHDEVVTLVRALVGDPRSDEADAARQSALAAIALTSGGIVLARAVADTPLSDEILQACRAFAETALSRPRPATAINERQS